VSEVTGLATPAHSPFGRWTTLGHILWRHNSTLSVNTTAQVQIRTGVSKLQSHEGHATWRNPNAASCVCGVRTASESSWLGTGRRERQDSCFREGKVSGSESGVSENSDILGMLCCVDRYASPTGRNLVRLPSNPERLGHVCWRRLRPEEGRINWPWRILTDPPSAELSVPRNSWPPVRTLNQCSDVDGEKWVRPADLQREGALLSRKDEQLLDTAVSDSWAVARYSSVWQMSCC